MSDEPWRAALGRVLVSWQGTPYRPGQAMRGRGVDCVHFIDEVLLELAGRPPVEPLPRLPAAMSLHDRRGATRAVHSMARRHTIDVLRGARPTAGDVLIYKRGAAPGHVLIVGPDERTAWHADEEVGVCFTSVVTVMKSVMRAYRPRYKEAWR